MQIGVRRVACPCCSDSEATIESLITRLKKSVLIRVKSSCLINKQVSSLLFSQFASLVKTLGTAVKCKQETHKTSTKNASQGKFQIFVTQKMTFSHYFWRTLYINNAKQ
jgi:hypothetical protein